MPARQRVVADGEEREKFADAPKTLLDDLRAANFTHAFGTTAPKALPMCRDLGVNVLGEAQIKGRLAISRFRTRYPARGK